MRKIWECPVEGCGSTWPTPKQLEGHIGKAQESDPKHQWDRVPVSPTDMDAAVKYQPTVYDFDE